MYGEQHLLSYRVTEGNTVVNLLGLIPLNYRQLAWWFGGGFVSFKLVSWLPALPGMGLWGYFPHWLPFVGALVFSHGRHPGTEMTLERYFWYWWKCKRRKKVFLG